MSFGSYLHSDSFAKCPFKILFFSKVNGLVWWTWHQLGRHHECGDGRVDRGEPAARPRCGPPESTGHSWRPRLFARPHPVFRSPQPTGRLLCTIGKENQSICTQSQLRMYCYLFRFLFTRELCSIFLVGVLNNNVHIPNLFPVRFVIYFVYVFCYICHLDT